MKVVYYDECKWVDEGEGLSFNFVADESILAHVAMRDAERKLWSFEVNLPETYRFNGHTPAGLVYTAATARKVAETILLGTIVTK